MFEKIKGNKTFTKLMKRQNINLSYAMVEPSDSWYNIISTIHNSLNEMKKLPHNEVEITSHDNLKLKGIYYPNSKKSSVTVICLHGYASHPEKEMAFSGLFYLSQGYNVLITYQRAHGLSQGKFMSLGVLEQQDMIRWIDKVNEMNPSGNIIIHGLSMGGGIAFHLVDKNIKNVKCFIIDAPNHSLKHFFKEAAFEFYKKNQDKITFYTIQRFEKEFNTDINKSEIVDIASNSKYPILLTAGSNEDFEEIFATVKSRNPKDTEIVILPECDHANGMYRQTAMYQNSIIEFVNKYLGK